MAGWTAGDDPQAPAPAPDVLPDAAADDTGLEVAPLDERSGRLLARSPRALRWLGRWRRPLVGALTVALALGVTLGLFARSTSNPAAAIATLLGAAPTTTAVHADDIFAAVHGVPWGALTISGQRMSPTDALGGIFQLAPGAHTVEYRAADFPTLRCVVSVPHATSDTCPLAHPADVSDTPQVYDAARLIDLGATPERLSAARRSALLTAISRALAADGATTTIVPGEPYLDASGSVRVASQPLRYSVTPELASFHDSQQAVNSLGRLPCGPVCAAGADPQLTLTSVAQGGWALETMVELARVVSDTSGRTVTRQQAPVGVAQVNDVTLLVTRSADGAWQLASQTMAQNVVAQIAPLFCASSLAQQLQGGKGGFGFGGTFLTLMPRDPADGCVIAVIPPGANPTGADASSGAILVLSRFGVLLAANTSAHLALWRLPIADATARAIATQTFLSATLPAGAQTGG